MPNEWQRRVEQHFGSGTPPRPSAATPAGVPDLGDKRERNYALGALRSAAGELAATSAGRNGELNRHAFKLAGFVNTGLLTEGEVRDALTDAGRAASPLGDHAFTDEEIAATLNSALGGGAAKGLTRAAPENDLDADVVEVAPGTLPGRHGHASDDEGEKVYVGRVVHWQTGDQIATAAPVWAWVYGGHGRIQLGTLALLAGRPGAGKSTAARWFAAQATLGTLDGYWEGKPQHVAYIATEESTRYTIGPGLIAAGADMSRIHLPTVTRDGELTALLSTLDETAVFEYLADHRVSVLIVDPLMSTVTATTDINKNNEIRSQIAPWARMAERLHGITLGVAHLRKSNTGDVVAAITGSSAFGEVARAVFGFAKNSDNDTRVMSQHKNSTGYEDLSVTYEIASRSTVLGDGKVAEIGTFAITGDSEVSVEDILSDASMNGTGGQTGDCRKWLQDYLSVEGPILSKTVKVDAKKAGDWSGSTIDRAARKLKVHIESKDFPRVTYWSLPITSSVAPRLGTG
jgi:hypothetical protein